MPTFPCTVAEYNAAFCEFFKAIGDKSSLVQKIMPSQLPPQICVKWLAFN